LRAGAAATLAASASLDTLVQHAGPEHVESVMVAGQWVMRAGRILAFDEATILQDARAQAIAVQARVAPLLPTLLAALPGMAARFRCLPG
jgi:cytosine/adenosine deaminase-related metal-dependent hydrolase